MYARNRGGFYLRHFTKPLNPNTGAQMDSRNGFDNAASAWKNLTDYQKAAWNSYADTNYTPKKGVSASKPSGFNAFTALHNACNSANRTIREITVQLPEGVTTTEGTFTPTDGPPPTALGGQIQDSTNQPLGITVGEVTFSSADAAVTLTLDLSTHISAAPKFLDSIGSVPVGLSVQLSKALSAGQTFVASPSTTCVLTIPPVVMTGVFVDVEQIQFRANAADLDISKFKLWYTTGQRAQADVYLVGNNGAQRLLGSKIVLIS